MTDLDLLTGAIAARLRLLPDVARLYPARDAMGGAVQSVGALLTAVAEDQAVVLRADGEGYRVEVSVGLVAGCAAVESGAAVAAAVRAACDGADTPVGCVRVRISSID